MKRPLALMLTSVATLAPAAVATAQERIAPPGNAGVDQYAEVVPTAKGGARGDGDRKGASGGAGGNTRGGSGVTIPRNAAEQLSQAGREGEQLLQATRSSAPTRPPASSSTSASRGDRTGGRLDGAAGTRGVEARDTPSTLKATADTVFGRDSSGTSWVLPSLLVLTTAAFAGAALIRLRRST